MPHTLLPALALVAALPLAAAADEPPALDSVESRYSYGLGLSVAQTLRRQGIDQGLDPAAFALGIRDLLSDAEPRLTEEEVAEAFSAIEAVFAEQAAAAAEEAKATGEAFLAENASADGITVTDSGVQYRVVQGGEGATPAPENTVRVHYEGQLLDGTVFDSSYERGAPAEFGVTQVIQGWQEVLQLMQPGAIWDVWIPSELAYGARGAGSDIGPNETLKFRIELIEVVDG